MLMDGYGHCVFYRCIELSMNTNHCFLKEVEREQVTEFSCFSLLPFSPAHCWLSVNKGLLGDRCALLLKGMTPRNREDPICNFIRAL